MKRAWEQAKRIFHYAWLVIRVIFVLLVLVVMVGLAEPLPVGTWAKARAYTRSREFEFVKWTVDALGVKLSQAALDAPRYMSQQQQRQIVDESLSLVYQLWIIEDKIEDIFTDPSIDDPQAAAAEWINQLKDIRARLEKIQPLSESIIQYQLGVVLAELGLSSGGQPFPPVLYRVTPLPMVMIISPREVIRREASITLVGDLSLEEISALESAVEKGMNVSALVEPIGGMGIFPTMIIETGLITVLVDIVAHEWTHNYLTLRPLGMNYFTSVELMIINETTASLVGREIALEYLRRYYPEYLPKDSLKPKPEENEEPGEPTTPKEPKFNYRKEMSITRERVDELLAEGKIEEAEAYMEQRRQLLWENGYRIRRLNQAFFAFHGSYADRPGGAAGTKDPIGPAVRALWERRVSLADFLNTISSVTSLEQLQALVAASAPGQE